VDVEEAVGCPKTLPSYGLGGTKFMEEVLVILKEVSIEYGKPEGIAWES